MGGFLVAELVVCVGVALLLAVVLTRPPREVSDVELERVEAEPDSYSDLFG